MPLNMWDIDRLADAYYADRDPQYDDGLLRCDGCGCKFEYDEMTEVGDRLYCADCLQDLEEDEK